LEARSQELAGAVLAASERRERKDVSAALEIQGGNSSVEDVFSL
jgi:hypothetical protein